MKKTYNKIVSIMKKKAVAYDFPYMQFFRLNISEDYTLVFDAETGALFGEKGDKHVIYFLNIQTPYCLEPELQTLLKDLENATV